MKLLELSSDKSSFHPIRFNIEGPTLIVGDGAREKSKEGSSNGVGKTLALGLVHHCLGANADASLKDAVPDWKFELTFELQGTSHTITRTGDGKKIWLDGRKMAVGKLRNWLDESGVFRLDSSVPFISFRSLVKRFARYRQEDCLDPLSTYRENDFDARLRTLYLLGLDCSLALNKRKHKLELDGLSGSIAHWRHDELLRETFRAGTEPKLRAEWLDAEIPRLEQDLQRFQVAENYRAIELAAGQMTTQLRRLDEKLAILGFQSRNIEKSLAEHPDISKQDLLELYAGAKDIFRPETLAHLDAVESFHKSLTESRRQRLSAGLANARSEMQETERKRAAVAKERDEKLATLQGKRALDEFATIANQVAALKAERDRLRGYQEFTASLQTKAQHLRELRVEEDRLAAEYLASNPISLTDERFKHLAQQMYPRMPAGVVLDNNVGENQVRFNLSARIQGDSSDGINAARILCFDLVVFLFGANHTMDWLWHDNRLFADIDPKSRASWFHNVLSMLPGTGKQYIATINTENYDAMSEHLNESDIAALHDSVALKLTGDAPENKLLGIQFGRKT